MRRRQFRRANAFRLNGAAVLAGSEHEIGDAGTDDRFLALFVGQRVDQLERLVVLLAERANRPPFDRVDRGLRRGQARRHARLASRQRQVDREMVAAELQHPRRRHRRRTEEREEVLVFGEAETPASATAATAAPTALGRATRAGRRTARARGRTVSRRRTCARRRAGGRTAAALALRAREHAVRLHDLFDLAVAVGAQRRREQRVDGGALRRVQIREAHPLALENPGRKVGPLRLLRAVVGELHLGASRFVE